jgi:hypothetical protein
MDIVLTGTEEWAIDSVRRSLRNAGHHVHSCFEESSPGSPCAGKAPGGTCPATRHIDVIVAVRAHPLPHLTPHEQATSCPMLDGVPVVVAGSTAFNPYGSRAVRCIEGYDGIEAACRDLAAPRQPLP